MKFKTSKEAKQAAFKSYQGFCIMSGLNNVAIANAHIWPAGAKAELKCWSENILPMRYDLHTNGNNTFDWIALNKKARTPIEKIHWLYDNGVHEDFRFQVFNQLEELLIVLGYYSEHKQEAMELKHILVERVL